MMMEMDPSDTYVRMLWRYCWMIDLTVNSIHDDFL
jgi:hypothetical protein